MCLEQMVIDPTSFHTVASFCPSNHWSYKVSGFLDAYFSTIYLSLSSACEMDAVANLTRIAQVWFHEPDHMLHWTSSQ